MIAAAGRLGVTGQPDVMPGDPAPLNKVFERRCFQKVLKKYLTARSTLPPQLLPETFFAFPPVVVAMVVFVAP